MRVAFITGSLERGTDGVGDYTRWLAAESSRHGASCRLIALADRHIASPLTGRDDLGLETLRLPFNMPWPERLLAAKRFFASSPPDWVSLQFVPYSFHRSGFTAALVRALPDLVGGARLHLMFHEIWIDGGTSWRRRLVSARQRRSILALARWPHAVIHTSNAAYQQALNDHGVRAGVLPLFGSIPIAEPADATAWLAPLLASVGCDALSGAPVRRSDWWLFALFGTLHPVWPPQPLLDELVAAGAAAGRRVALISAGRLGAGEALWTSISTTHGDRIAMLRLGAQTSDRISQLLQSVDYGIATSPLQLIGKSATAAAMFDHGLPVVVNREDCCWPAPPVDDAREAALVIRLGPGFPDRLRHARRLPPAWRLSEVATQWIAELSAAAVTASAWSF